MGNRDCSASQRMTYRQASDVASVVAGLSCTRLIKWINAEGFQSTLVRYRLIERGMAARKFSYVSECCVGLGSHARTLIHNMSLEELPGLSDYYMGSAHEGIAPTALALKAVWHTHIDCGLRRDGGNLIGARFCTTGDGSGIRQYRTSCVVWPTRHSDGGHPSPYGRQLVVGWTGCGLWRFHGTWPAPSAVSHCELRDLSI